jgi:DNA uptake protein ComE-like DNA-binding protein
VTMRPIGYLRGMALPPALSPEARQAALAKAAIARTVRAELKAQLKMGAITLAEVLERGETDEIVGNTKVLVLLESLPGLGKVKARRTLEEIGIAETRRVRGLGGNQRTKLLDLAKPE